MSEIPKPDQQPEPTNGQLAVDAIKALRGPATQPIMAEEVLGRQREERERGAAVDGSTSPIGEGGLISGSPVDVLRTSGEVESGWQVSRYDTNPDGKKIVRVIKPGTKEGEKGIEKWVSATDLEAWQPKEEDEAPKNLKEQLGALDDIDDRHLDPHTAARIDLMKASQAVETATVPEDSLVSVKFGEAAEYVFHKPKEPKVRKDGREEWTWIREGENGESIEIPVVMMGASSETGSFIEADKAVFRKGQNFVFGEIHRFKQGSDEGVPERFSLFKAAEDLDPKILQENLDTGIMERAKDGSIQWYTVDELILPHVQQVNSLGLQGAEEHLK